MSICSNLTENKGIGVEAELKYSCIEVDINGPKLCNCLMFLDLLNKRCWQGVLGLSSLQVHLPPIVI